MRYLKDSAKEISPSRCNATETPREGEGRRWSGWRAMSPSERDAMAAGLIKGSSKENSIFIYIFFFLIFYIGEGEDFCVSVLDARGNDARPAAR